MLKYTTIRKTPLIRILLLFIIGILIANYFELQFTNKTNLIFITTLTLLIILLITLSIKKLSNLFDYFLLPLVISIAICITILNTKVPTNFENEHIWQGIICEKPLLKNNSILLTIKLSPKLFHSDKIYKSQKLLLYTTKDTNTISKIAIGDRVIFSAKIKAIQNYGNPDEFNYAKYLHITGINLQAYTPLTKIKFIPSTKFNIQRWLSDVQHRALNQYASSFTDKDVLAIVSALTLGYKHYLSDELKQTYVNSGAVHVLAVSGLHIGIIFMFLNFALSFLNGNKGQRNIKISLIIIIIWLYAALSGLSPSISRATLMFTLIGVGKTINRDISIFNILACAALILLIANPLSLYNVGFQLSFLAVGGILYFQPLLFNLFSFRNSIANKIYELFTLSVAAQITTAPLCMFYFHQFPSYFWLTNILLIPLISIGLIASILFILTSWVPYFSIIIAFIVELVLKQVNNWVRFIDALPYSVINNIQFSFTSLIISFALIAFTMAWLRSKRTTYLQIILTLFIFGGIISLKSKVQYRAPNKIVFYNLPKENYIGIYNGDRNYLVTIGETAVNKNLLNSYFKPHWMKMHCSSQVDTLNTKFLYEDEEKLGGNTKYLSRITMPNSESVLIWDKNLKKTENNLSSKYVYICNNVWPPNFNVSSDALILSNTLDKHIKQCWKDYALENRKEVIELSEFGALTVKL